MRKSYILILWFGLLDQLSDLVSRRGLETPKLLEILVAKVDSEKLGWPRFCLDQFRFGRGIVQSIPMSDSGSSFEESGLSVVGYSSAGRCGSFSGF